jgi:hypothetical protein
MGAAPSQAASIAHVNLAKPEIMTVDFVGKRGALFWLALKTVYSQS